MSALQGYKKIEQEIKAQQRLFSNNDKKQGLADILLCEIHQNKLSNNCRQCRKLKETQRQLEEPEEPIKIVELISKTTGDNVFPIQGDSPSANLNPMLKQNIINCQYYREMSVRSYHDVLAEIERACNNAEPWAIGGQGVPSTLFCCLYKLMTINLSVYQVKNLTEYRTNNYVRCCGFLYVRYACDPAYLWAWMKKFILEDEEFTPAVDHNKVMSIGEYVELLLTDQQYFSTRLPRIPMIIETKIQAKIVIAREKRQRQLINKRIMDQFVSGVRVRGVSHLDDEWHFGFVDRFEGKMLLICFEKEETFAGGIEPITLGEVELMPQDTQAQESLAQLMASRFQDVNSRSSSVDRRKKHNQQRSRSRSQSNKKKKYESNKERSDRLELEMRQRQKNKAVADNRSDVARMPASYKSALSGALPTTTLPKARPASVFREKEQFVQLNQPLQQQQQQIQQDAPQPQPQNTHFQSELKKKYGDNSQKLEKLNEDYV